MTPRLIRCAVAAVGTAAVLWWVPIRAAQERGRGAQNAQTPVATPRTPEGLPDLSGRCGGGGNEIVKVTDPSGETSTFPS